MKGRQDTSIPGGTEAIKTPTSNAAASTGANPRMVDIVFKYLALNYPALFDLTV
jgi:hypothetical protein